MKRFYESDIKELILDKAHIFGVGAQDKHTVLFEKAIVVGSTIADCIIFSADKGIIGIEVKTERDSTRRLNKQLKHYSMVCDTVYVLCHDNHITSVEQILNKNGHGHVGIISYTEFRGEPVVGVYKEAIKSPYKRVQTAYQLLWKAEIVNILGSFKRQVQTLEEFGIKVDSADSRSNGLHELYTKSNASSKYLKKPQMIEMIVSRLGEVEANRLLCNIFISGKMHPDKLLKFYHFRNKH